MGFNPNKPFNDLPSLPPSGRLWENITVFRKLADARAAVAELKGRMPIIPNPMMLVNTLVLQEAKDSSSIENIFTSSDKLYKAFASASAATDSQTKEVLRYRLALYDGWQQQQQSRFTLDLIENIYRRIKDRDDGIRNHGVFIGNQFKVVYTPPCCDSIIRKMLSDWLHFGSNDDDIDPLIKMAMMHYQFEAIHPFSDGNGRTGRVLNVLYLTQTELLDQPILYLSRYINNHKSDYYRLLRDVTENGNWQDWIVYMLVAVKETASQTLQTINQIFELYSNTIQRVKLDAADIYSRELIDMLFMQPYSKISFLVESDIASRNTASKYLNRLADIGILEKSQVGNEFLYLNKQLYDLIAE